MILIASDCSERAPSLLWQYFFVPTMGGQYSRCKILITHMGTSGDLINMGVKICKRDLDFMAL